MKMKVVINSVTNMGCVSYCSPGHQIERRGPRHAITNTLESRSCSVSVQRNGLPGLLIGPPLFIHQLRPCKSLLHPLGGFDCFCLVNYRQYLL